MANEHMTTGESDGKDTNKKLSLNSSRSQTVEQIRPKHITYDTRQKELKLLQNYQIALQCLYTKGIVEK